MKNSVKTEIVSVKLGESQPKRFNATSPHIISSYDELWLNRK
jgi:hypothetical protein